MSGRLSGSLAGPDGRLPPGTARALVAVGCLLILMGVVPLQRGLTRIVFGTRSAALVVSRTEPVRRQYMATLEFRPVGGPAVRIDRRMSARRVRMLSPGERIGVAYFPGAPEAAEIEDYRADWSAASTR